LPLGRKTRAGRLVSVGGGRYKAGHGDRPQPSSLCQPRAVPAPRRRAEDALNRILDPLRARIAYLESLHVPQTVGAMTRSVYFDTGSAAVKDSDQATLDEVAGFISQYPIATVVVTGYADTKGSQEANRALAQRRAQAVAQALRGLGGPVAGSVSVVAVGEPEGAADAEANQENRRVEILVAPHGTYNKGP
jgi:outer membrane protein OmpA-like peptidoglycan-associated protein